MSPTSARSGWRVAFSSRLDHVERDELRLLADRAAEGEAEVERDADDEGDVGLLEALAAGAAEAELVVGGQAAAAHAVEEDGDAERLGEGAELLLPVGPVEAGAGHDRGALGLRQQRGGFLGAIGRLAGRSLRRGRHLGLGLGEDHVERVVDEGRARRLGERLVDRRGGELGDVGGVLDRLRPTW